MIWWYNYCLKHCDGYDVIMRNYDTMMWSGDQQSDSPTLCFCITTYLAAPVSTRLSYCRHSCPLPPSSTTVRSPHSTNNCQLCFQSASVLTTFFSTQTWISHSQYLAVLTQSVSRSPVLIARTQNIPLAWADAVEACNTFQINTLMLNLERVGWENCFKIFWYW